MDHCALPSSPVHEPLHVPYFGFTPAYEPPFENFYKKCQWTDAELFRYEFDGAEHEFDDLDPLLQSWLFFGLIEETLGVLSKFYRAPWSLVLLNKTNAAGQLLINTSILRQQFDGLRQTLHGHEEHRRESMKLHAATHIKIAYDVLRKQLDQTRRLALKHSTASHPGAVQSPTTLSILCLCAYLSSVYGLYSTTRPHSFEYLEQGLLEVQMLRDGWCPSQVRRLSRGLLPPSLYFLSNLRRPDPHLDHAMSDAAPGQRQCTEFQCFASQVRLGEYKTKHDAACISDQSGANCPFLAVDQAQMFEWLRNGILPLVLYIEDPPSLRLVPSSDFPIYVAISHVWAHGLGNADENALPQCQLRRLSAMVKELYSSSECPVPFWIDTLSCPTAPEEATSLAILQMRRTYSCADKVLVIDSYFDVNAINISDTEIFLRILCSAWTTRLWTFQEGALAQDIHFRFRDVAVEPGAIRKRVYADPGISAMDVDQMLQDLSLGWFSADSHPSTLGQLLIHLARAVRHRTTSVPEDEALCLGTLAGIDMEHLANPKIRPKERMRAFWDRFEAPPSMLVFWEGENLKDPGYRWAPKGFLDTAWAQVPGITRKGFYENMMQEQTKFISGIGLEIRAPGLLLGVWTSMIGNTFYVRIGEGIWLYVTCCSDKGLQGKERDTSLDPQVFENGGLEGSRATNALAIILQNEMEASVLDPWDERTSAHGVLVTVQRPSAGVLGAMYLTDVFIISVSSCYSQEPSTLWLQELASKLDKWTMPDGEENVVIWDDPFSSEGLVDWSNREGGEWYELDENKKEKGCRWNYGHDGFHFVFQGLSLAPDQAWCVS